MCSSDLACIFLRLVVCQLLHLLLFSPILKSVFFTLLIVSFDVQKLLRLIRSHLLIFAFICNILGPSRAFTECSATELPSAAPLTSTGVLRSQLRSYYPCGTPWYQVEVVGHRDLWYLSSQEIQKEEWE